MTEFIAAAYKSDGGLIWVSGVVAAMLIPIFIVTGDLLPWDQRAYWSTQIRTSILDSVPWIGDFLVGVLQGGSRIGVAALTRFYVLHILLLPCALMVLLALHSYLVVGRWRSKSSSGQADARAMMRVFPDAAQRGLGLFLVVAVVLGVAAWLRPAPLGDPADPADATYVPRPEWWVLSLNQIVTHCKGPLAVVGSTLVPVGLVAFLIALPVLDRGSERRPSKRRGVIIIASLIGVVLVGLSIAGYFDHYASSPAEP
jgi:ubiquinol-cytochrome c reductase cytochrome b subunit